MWYVRTPLAQGHSWEEGRRGQSGCRWEGGPTTQPGHDGNANHDDDYNGDNDAHDDDDAQHKNLLLLLLPRGCSNPSCLQAGRSAQDTQRLPARYTAYTLEPPWWGGVFGGWGRIQLLDNIEKYWTKYSLDRGVPPLIIKWKVIDLFIRQNI